MGAAKCIRGQSSEVKSKVCCEVHSLLLVSVLFQLIEICVVGVVIFSTACSWLGVCLCVCLDSMYCFWCAIHIVSDCNTSLCVVRF